MTVQELEQAIRDMFTELYCKEYTGRLSVVETFSTFPGEDPVHLGYIVKIGLNKDERPIDISKECTAEEFLDFVRQELKDRSFQRTKYFTAIQLYNDEEGRQIFN